MIMQIVLNSTDIKILQSAEILESKIIQDWTRIVNDRLMGHSVGIDRKMK